MLSQSVPLSETFAVAQEGIVSVSRLFKKILELADSVAQNECVVLLEGESGTGKELLARRIHYRSARAKGPFIPVNCPAITDTLFESQFFGHVRGAFTGAFDQTLGAVRAADGGTLLLDEIGDLPFQLQSKLLRLLQEREVTPVGASQPISVNARFIASTNRNLSHLVSEGAFRADLYHRLNIVKIQVPPLRDRPEDIDPLLDHYLNYFAIQYSSPLKKIDESIRQKLRTYPWLGNVRELCGYIERLYAANLTPAAPGFCSWVAPHDNDHPRLQSLNERGHYAHEQSEANGDNLDLTQNEANTIRRALQITNHNHSAAARMLNIHRSTLLRKIRFLGLEPPE